MKRRTSNGDILLLLVFDYTLMVACALTDYDVVEVKAGSLSQLNCSAAELMLLYNCSYETREIQKIILSKRMDEFDMLGEILVEMVPNKTAKDGTLIPRVVDPKGWLVRFGDHNLTARFFDSTRDINGIYLCTVVVVHDTETIVMNMTVILTVIGKRSSELERKLPLQVLSHMYEIMIVLLALMLFCCMFIFICASMEEKTTVKEKEQKLRLWKVQMMKRKKELEEAKKRSKHSFKSYGSLKSDRIKHHKTQC